MVPIDNDVKKHRVKESTRFAGATSHWIGTDYDGVVRPILLLIEQHTAANVYTISNVPVLILYLHACAGFPVIAT